MISAHTAQAKAGDRSGPREGGAVAVIGWTRFAHCAASRNRPGETGASVAGQGRVVPDLAGGAGPEQRGEEIHGGREIDVDVDLPAGNAWDQRGQTGQRDGG